MAGLVLTHILEVPMMMEMPVDTGVMTSLKCLVQSLPGQYMNVDEDVDKYVVEYVEEHSVTKVMASIFITVQMASVDTEVVDWSSCPE